jgi:hypothetical protein
MEERVNYVIFTTRQRNPSNEKWLPNYSAVMNVINWNDTDVPYMYAFAA